MALNEVRHHKVPNQYKPYRDAQNRLLKREDLSCTYLAHHEPESIITVIAIFIKGIAECNLQHSLQRNAVLVMDCPLGQCTAQNLRKT